MRIAILGAGFTGLAAAFYLADKHEVTIFEKEDIPGGLANSFREADWEWPLEKHYHHFFTSDQEIIDMAKKIDFFDSLIFPDSLTSLFYQNKVFPFNGAFDILKFSPLNLFSRLRLGLVTIFLKSLPASIGQRLEKTTATKLAKFFYGQQVYQTVWEPLLKGKFGDLFEEINAAWLWARIKKRTLKLGYFKGGYQAFAKHIETKIKEKGIKILYNQEIIKAEQLTDGRWQIQTKNLAKPDLAPQGQSLIVDLIISTLPAPVFLKLFPDLPETYRQQLSSIPHLHALNLLLELKQPFLEKNTYWLNINDKRFPFLCLVEQTNFIDKKHYGNSHLLYIGNYLPSGHPYLAKTAGELLKIYEPYLKRVNPLFNFQFSIFNFHLFVGQFAQPVFLKNYSQIRPFGKTPLSNLYFANLDSVYPWDRGTNYALEIGRKVAEMVNDNG